MNKISQSISINAIVIAAIALGVLIVVFIIFTGQTSVANKNLQSCELKGGKCASSLSANNGKETKDYACDNEYPVKITVNDPACGPSKLCCLKIG